MPLFLSKAFLVHHWVLAIPEFFNYFEAMYYILGESCFTGILDDLVLDDFQVGEFDRFLGKNT